MKYVWTTVLVVLIAGAAFGQKVNIGFDKSVC
jgi:hypothetical protein